jgi:sorbitol-specific phosphotransferase system component IIA
MVLTPKTCIRWLILSLLITHAGQAAPPTAQQCLEASNQSLELDNENLLIKERAKLLICSDPSCPATIRKECIQRGEAVAEAIPTIVFEFKDSYGQDIREVSVTVDGQPLADTLDGLPLELDPGPHVFRFQPRHASPVERQLVINTAQKNRHEIIVTEPMIEVKSAKHIPATPTRSSELRPQHIAALMTAGLGGVGIAIGGVLGALAISRKSEAKAHCPGAVCLNQADSQRWNDAYSAGNASTIAFAIGGAALTTGLVLWFTAPPRGVTRTQERTSFEIGPGVVQVKGHF